MIGCWGIGDQRLGVWVKGELWLVVGVKGDQGLGVEVKGELWLAVGVRSDQRLGVGLKVSFG